MSMGTDTGANQRTSSRGFGVDVTTSSYHFVVRANPDGSVTILERVPSGGADGERSAGPVDTPKAHVTAYRWSRIVEPVTREFIARLRVDGQRGGRWLKRETPVRPYFGKELTLLAWAIEEADATLLPTMIANWSGLAPEERWWFYTTINATAGTPDHGKDRGWRQAIKIAFASNPVDLPPSALLVGPQEVPPPAAHRKASRAAKRAGDNTQGKLRLFDD